MKIMDNKQKLGWRVGNTLMVIGEGVDTTNHTYQLTDVEIYDDVDNELKKLTIKFVKGNKHLYYVTALETKTVNDKECFSIDGLIANLQLFKEENL
jgi:hypothetical protein